jgi:hypothetical protein
MSLEIFYEKVAKGFLVRYGNSAQGHTVRPVERIPVTHARLEGKLQCLLMPRVYRNKQVPDWKNCEEMHHNVPQKMQYWTLYRAVIQNVSLKTELLGVKVTIAFHRQCHKNLSLRNG